MRVKPVHPFPARMAPELAISGLKELTQPSIILDPMSGSGTVVRHASDMGHQCYGFDMDPLAVLMTKVWTTSVDDSLILKLKNFFWSKFKQLPSEVELDWIDFDSETLAFTEFWFGQKQLCDLRKLSYIFNVELKDFPRTQQNEIDVLKIALSRIIITKKKGASLAWDVSHSRPHKVYENSDFDVMSEFEKSINYVRKVLNTQPPKGNVNIETGDARFLSKVYDQSIDLVLTSPPYLNAIDYMRGHKMSLVWFGYKISNLRQVRSTSIGAERGIDSQEASEIRKKILSGMGSIEKLPTRYQNIVSRYADDLYEMMHEIFRVLRHNGKAILVLGNSFLKGEFIQNSNGVIEAAQLVGLNLFKEYERVLPTNSRYLPLPNDCESPLGKRMRTETILQFNIT